MKKYLREIGLTYKSTPIKTNKVTDSQSAYNVIKQLFQDDIVLYESCFILCLDSNCNTIGYAKVSQGGTSSTAIDIKIIMKYAIGSLCSQLIIAHNHPNGKLEPSPNDMKIVNNLKKACDVMQIKLVDSLILSENGYHSAADLVSF